MRTRTLAALLAVIAVATTLALSLPARSEEEGGRHGAAKIAALLEQAKITLTDAVKAAETKTGGKAVAAGLELDDEGLVFEVLVVVAGDVPALFEVEVDAKTGKILEVEGEDDDDADDDDDEDDEDDEED